MSTVECVLVIAAGILIYAHILFPALMVLVALPVKRAKEQSQGDRDWPRVSLIVAAYNEEAVIESKIENALTIDYPKNKLEILVVSDGSIDRTVEIARRFESQRVRVLEFDENRGKATVVNDAVEQTNGQVLWMCDANVMFRADALKRLVVCLNDTRIGAVSGDVRLASHESDFGEGESTYYALERRIQLGESRIGSMMGVDGGMYIVRRDLYQPLPADTRNDDFAISMHVIRQGKRVLYEPTAVAIEGGTPQAHDEFRRRVRITSAAVQSIKRGQFPPIWRPIELWQYISHKLLRWLGPVWLCGLFVSSGLLWNEGVIYRVAFVSQVGVYVLALLAMVSIRFRQTRLGGIPFYFTMSHIAMGIGLVKGLFWKQKGTWKRTERTVNVPKNNRETAAGGDPS